MRQPPRHRPANPTTCDVSDLLNEIKDFVENNPMWIEDVHSVAKMMVAYSILRNISEPDMVTQEEYDFVMDIHSKIEERSAQ